MHALLQCVVETTHPVHVFLWLGEPVAQRQHHPRKNRLRDQGAPFIPEPADSPDQQDRQKYVKQRHRAQIKRLALVEHVIGQAAHTPAGCQLNEEAQVPEDLRQEDSDRHHACQQAAFQPQGRHGSYQSDVREPKEISGAPLHRVDGHCNGDKQGVREFDPERNHVPSVLRRSLFIVRRSPLILRYLMPIHRRPILRPRTGSFERA